MCEEKKKMYLADTWALKNQHDVTKLSNNPRTMPPQYSKVNHLEKETEDDSDPEPDDIPQENIPEDDA